MLDGDLSLQDALQRNYANISGIARLLKPKLEDELGRKVKIESIITAVKRAKFRYNIISEEIQNIVAASVVTVRTDVAKLVVERNRRVIQSVSKALGENQEEFMHIAGGPATLTIILDGIVASKVKELFRTEEVLDERKNLAAIIVHSPPDIIFTPGCAITFYNQVSRKHVNIDDTSSCHTDTIIVVSMDDVGSAFAALSELIAASRRPKRGK